VDGDGVESDEDDVEKDGDGVLRSGQRRLVEEWTMTAC
jgi:hypothetical protein